jgi:hypothetical protein
MEVKSMILAMLFGALVLMAMLNVIADFGRNTTYSATLGAENDAKLNQISTKLSEMQNKTIAMKERLDNSTATQPGDSSAIGWVFRTPALFTLGISTLQMVFDLPDYIGTFVGLVITALPFGLGYLVVGIVGIIGAIIVFQIIGALTGWNP